MSGVDIPARFVRNQIGTSVDLFIQINRYRDGSRKISLITKVELGDGEDLALTDIFQFKKQGLTEAGDLKGSFQCVNTSPGIKKRFHQAGIEFLDDALTT